MNHTPEALQLANQLEANYAHVYAGLAPAAAAALHYWRETEAHKFARAIEEAVWKQNS